MEYVVIENACWIYQGSFEGFLDNHMVGGSNMSKPMLEAIKDLVGSFNRIQKVGLIPAFNCKIGAWSITIVKE